MLERNDRTVKLIGSEGMRKLAAASVLIVGLGGVGGCVFEMLARAGIGKLTVADGDVFEPSNLNRQLLSTVQNIGTPKTAAAVMRAKEIAPDCVVTAKHMRYNEQTCGEIFYERYDYVADCIDSVADKTHLIAHCAQENIPVISAMGSGNRIAPRFEVTDIFSTREDGLARVMRKRLRDAGIKSLNVVCDSGAPLKREGTPGTVSYSPNMSGCVMAQHIITELLCK